MIKHNLANLLLILQSTVMQQGQMLHELFRRLNI